MNIFFTQKTICQINNMVDTLGPSGPNSEYVLKLAQALRDMNEHDEHVFAIERELLKLLPQHTLPGVST
ncbi:gamma-glutamylcyclotransferase [Rheinheimera sp.]|uniref:gamma-glutamylcyclotransferase n=1 Tax=Rheinheimera sp. TaxID=1869214 RepID=UPI0040487D61